MMNINRTDEEMPKPGLSVTPPFLDFGKYDPNLPLTDQTTKQVEVVNNGGGMLIGRVVPQVSWLIVSPVEFRLGEGQRGVHHVRISTGAPQYLNRREYFFNNVILVTSNGGSFPISGSYLSVPVKIAQPRPAPTSLLFLVPLLLIATILILVFGNRFLPERGMPVVAEENMASVLYTEGAGTALAQYTLTAAMLPAAAITPTLLTSTPDPLLSANLEDLTPVVSPTATVTMTPWPRNEYPNPEQFVRDYYALLNEREYGQAWEMLSENFQVSCCEEFGRDSFVVYKSWWDEVNRTEIQTAYLQAWDTNPAVVYVTLTYYFDEQEPVDDAYVISIITSSEEKTLLIDEVN